MERKLEGPSLILGGNARLPKDLTSGTVLELAMEVDLPSGNIIEVSFSPCLPVIHEFLRPLMVGRNIHKDIDLIINTIDQRLIHRTKKAVMAAIRDAIRQFQEHQYPRELFPEKEASYENPSRG